MSTRGGESVAMSRPIHSSYLPQRHCRLYAIRHTHSHSTMKLSGAREAMRMRNRPHLMVTRASIDSSPPWTLDQIAGLAFGVSDLGDWAGHAMNVAVFLLFMA
jgi:hypothetical protein